MYLFSYITKIGDSKLQVEWSIKQQNIGELGRSRYVHKVA